jgi:hypothetical protein
MTVSVYLQKQAQLYSGLPGKITLSSIKNEHTGHPEVKINYDGHTRDGKLPMEIDMTVPVIGQTDGQTLGNYIKAVVNATWFQLEAAQKLGAVDLTDGSEYRSTNNQYLKQE